MTGRVVIGVVAALALAAPASAHFPQSADITVPPGGTATVTSSALPATARSASIKVGEDDNGLFTALGTMLAGVPTPGRRILTCIGIYVQLKSVYGDDEDYEVADPSLQTLFLAACLKLAVLINQAQAGHARAAAVRCSPQTTGIGMTVTRSGAQYHMKVSGTTKKAPSKLVVTCRRSSRGMTLKIRPRDRRQTLRKALGSKLGISYYNPDTGRSAKLKTTFAVR